MDMDDSSIPRSSLSAVPKPSGPCIFPAGSLRDKLLGDLAEREIAHLQAAIGIHHSWKCLKSNQRHTERDLAAANGLVRKIAGEFDVSDITAVELDFWQITEIQSFTGYHILGYLSQEVMKIGTRHAVANGLLLPPSSAETVTFRPGSIGLLIWRSMDIDNLKIRVLARASAILATKLHAGV